MAMSDAEKKARRNERMAERKRSELARTIEAEGKAQTAKDRKQRVPFTGRPKKGAYDPNKTFMWWMVK